MKGFTIGLFVLAFVAAVVAWAFPASAKVDQQPIHVAAGVNGAWLDGPGSAFPADIEVGGSAWSSLSPRISATANGFYGCSHSYLYGDAGARFTFSDAENPNLNSYLGVAYLGGSTKAMQPWEWAVRAGAGLRPLPASWPGFTIGADATYGLKTSRAIFKITLRQALNLP